MKNYAISKITDGILTKGEKYPILSGTQMMVYVDVQGKQILVGLDDTDFEFHLNVEE